MNFRLTILAFLLTFVSISWSQQIGIPNLSGSYLQQSYPLFNPASIKKNSTNIFLSHKQGVGVFSLFTQNYLNANYCFGSNSIKKHAIGIRIINDQGGKYIGINRTSLLYSYSLLLSSHYRLSLGIAPTIINHKKQAQNFGGSAMMGNLDVGLWFNTTKFMLGASINQIIENEFIVIEEVNLIKAQYVLNTKYSHEIHSLVTLDYQILYKFNIGLSNEEVAGITVNYLNNYRASINYENTENIYFLLGLKEISLTKLSGKFSVDFIYGISSLKMTYMPNNVIELMMNYDF